MDTISPLPIPSPPPNSPTHIEVPESCFTCFEEAVFLLLLPLNQRSGEFSSRVDVAPGRPMSRELDYGITDTWDDLVGAIEEIAPTTLEGVNQRVTNLSTTIEQETTIMYGMMEDAQDDRSLLRARVKLLYRDRHVHRRLAVMIEREARMAREAWGLSMDASDYARSDVMSLRTTIVGQRALISELQSADHRRQGVIKELLAADHQRQVQLTKALKLLKGLQTQMAEFRGNTVGPAKVRHSTHARREAVAGPRFSYVCLSEYIRQLILYPHEIQLNHSFLHLFSDERMSDVDVFRLGVLDVVAT
ncbi:hypothetical protein Tco_0259875 [Tanacetum coccineum]